MFYSKLISFGSYLPKNILSNDDIAKSGIDTSDEWIYSRTGIKERRISDPEENSSDMGAKSVIDALENGKVNKDEIDLLIVATTTSDHSFPSTACVIAKKLELKSIPAFDLSAACTGFVYAISIAESMMKTGKYKCICVVGVDKMSSLVDWSDRNTAVLFGDGAGSCILKRSENDKEQSVIDHVIQGDGSLVDILKTKDAFTSGEKNGSGIFMNGKEVFKHAVTTMHSSIKELLEKNNLKIEDLNLIIPHQANDRIIQYLREKMNLPEEKVLSVVKNYANTSAASIPIAFNYALKNKIVKKGDLVAISAIGSGLTWGAALIRI